MNLPLNSIIMAIGTLLEIYKACATYNNKKDKLRKFHSISVVLFFVKDDPSIPRVSKTARVFWRFTSPIWKWFNDLFGSFLVLTTLDFNILSLFSSSASFSAILSNANLSRSWGEKRTAIHNRAALLRSEKLKHEVLQRVSLL